MFYYGIGVQMFVLRRGSSPDYIFEGITMKIDSIRRGTTYPIAIYLFVVGCQLVASDRPASAAPIFHAQGEMAGEVGETSAILQSRLTESERVVDGRLPGAGGVACFEISQQRDFQDSRRTVWLQAVATDDFIIKTKVTGLLPGRQYYYRLVFGPQVGDVQAGDVCSFRTLPGKDATDEVSFVVVTGMNYVSFHHGPLKNGRRSNEDAYHGSDKGLGFPALATILRMRPDFFVGTGDNVYYDSRGEFNSDTMEGMRDKWHEQFAQPRFVDLFRQVPTYWEKDDHDHRFNDCDRAGDQPPSSDLGIRIFREQVPVVDPADSDARTYRTFRINHHLQMWLVEGRDFRSPNQMPDGPAKTLWGAEQIAWLKRTLLESDAKWKILISPTPMVGPDDAYKIDNHTNHKGFRHEGRAFFQWIKEHRLDQQGFYVICGDRHWQYHSIDPTGIEEFSCGALVDANSRLGRNPGDKDSTDPQAEIDQPYSQAEPSGGFLKVTITEDAAARFEFFDENGAALYRTIKQREDEFGVLGESAPELLRDYLLGQVRSQYDARRAAVRVSLQSSDAFAERQQRLLSSLRRLVGELPEKTPLRAQVTGVIEEDRYRIEKVVYQSRPNHYVTANLYLPTVGSGPFPAVLIACGHSALGKAYDSYQRAAILMALNGMVALVYDPIGQGERLSYLEGSSNAGMQHKLDNVNALLVGRTAVGYQAWDGIRSLDYLLSRPEADRSKPAGMTGNSGGGAQTMYLMALDDRVGPAAPSCHITTLERNFELGSAGDGCQSAPFTGAEGIDHPDFFAMRAPRPSIILSAERDYKDIRFTRETFGETKRVYALLEHADCIDMFAFDDEHSFSRPRREAAVRWMKRWLLDDSGPVSEAAEPELAEPTHSAAALQVTKSGQVLREFSDAMSVSQLNLRRAKQLEADRATFWKTRNRTEALNEVAAMSGVRLKGEKPDVEITGAVKHGSGRVEKLILRRPGEVPTPALLFLPHQVRAGNTAFLYVDGRGKAADSGPGGAIEQLVCDGRAVLSIDLRGFGETTDAPNSVVYSKGDHRSAMWSLHIGKTLLGQRVEDVLAASEYLRGRFRNADIELIGIGRAGPVVLHAAALDGRFARTTLRGSISSWVEDVIAQPRSIHAISHAVPSALLKYDLSDLAALLGNRLRTE